jgi:hypothetical protein
VLLQDGLLLRYCCVVWRLGAAGLQVCEKQPGAERVCGKMLHMQDVAWLLCCR